jgi:peptidoglycan/LPS O-acetylase OafA/YrhL
MISPTKSRELDIVRGLAAFLVLLAHMNQWFVLPLVGLQHGSCSVAQHIAHFSVLIFFVISGFVITDSLRENYRKNGYLDCSSYVSSRLARILPPAMVSIAFSCALLFLIHGLDLHGSEGFRTEQDHYLAREFLHISFKDILATSILSNGVIPGTSSIITNGPLWSLSLEFWAYFLALLFAVAIAYLGEKDRKMNSAGGVALIAALMLSLLLFCRPLDIGQFFVYWCIGSLFAINDRFPHISRCGIAAIMSIGAVSLGFCLFRGMDIDLVFGQGSVGLLLIPVKSAILIVLTLLLPLFAKIPGLGIFSHMAKSSYTLYVLHFPLLLLLFSFFHVEYMKWSPSSRGVFLATAGVAILTGCHFLAKPLEDKRTWATKGKLCFSWIAPIYKQIILSHHKR